MMRALIAGNWKMNGLAASLAEIRAMAEASAVAKAELLVCPPATLLKEAAAIAAGTALSIGAQDCHLAESGAHTGDLSAVMLKDAGAHFVIVGHSERRQNHSERSAMVKAKAGAAIRAGLTAIVCIGETEAERRAGKQLAVVSRQLAGSLPAGGHASNIVVAYEPVWAIGTGLTPTLDDIAEVHGLIAARLARRFGSTGAPGRILYGGSVKPDNAGSILAVPHVHGALVGGASLRAKDFLAIAASVRG